VHHNLRAKTMSYDSRVWRGGKLVHLGSFATAEEAALCVARSPEGRAAAKAAAAAPSPVPSLTSEEAQQQAQAEGLMLLEADSTTGYFGVRHNGRAKTKRYGARVWRGGKDVDLGSFATAEEAAWCIARSPEGQAAAKRAAAAPMPLTSKRAWQQAQAERLTLRLANSKTGYFGVHHMPSRFKPYKASVKRTHLGYFSTAEEAALCVARSPEGQTSPRSAAAPPLTSEDALQQARDAIVQEAALDIIHEAARAATAELSAEVAAEVMAGIAMGL